MEEVTFHIHHHFHFPSDPGQGKILSAIREVKDIAMDLNETLAQLTADDAELASDVVALVSIINDIPARIQAAVAGAMADAGISDEHTRAALNAVDLTVKDAIAAAKSVLPVAPAPSVDPSGTNTVGAGAGEDTISGGADGNDTVSDTTTATDTNTGASPSDTLVGGQGTDALSTGDTATAPNTSDTLAGGQASDSVQTDPAATNAASAQTDPTAGVVIPPPSASSAT